MKRVTPASVTFVVFTILIGLAAAYAVRHLNRGPEQAQAAAPRAKKATIVVAKINLPPYARVIEDYIDTVEVPADKVPEGAVKIKSRALYRLVRNTVMAGQPIREEDLYAVGELPLLSERLPAGQRAVTLAVDAKAALNGMIQPESLVDITLTVKNDHPEIGGLAALTLLRRVRVLATSRNRFPASEDRPGDLRNITVAVSAEDANKLILAQQYGTLSVVLCSKEDVTSSDATPVIPASASAGPEQLVPQPDPLTSDISGHDMVNINTLLGLRPVEVKPQEKPVPKTAQIWRGNSVEEVTFADWQVEEAENATLAAEGKKTTPLRVVPSGAAQAAPNAEQGDGKADCPACEKKRLKEAAQAAQAAAGAGVSNSHQGGNDVLPVAVGRAG
ncbi:Flp pilus assembly protein CpaB [Thermopirellula anaerolimosa]